MKNLVKWFGFIALVAIIGFTMAGCVINTGDGGSGGNETPNTSLNGYWLNNNDGTTIRINGSTGVFTQMSSTPHIQSAVNKGLIKIGDEFFRRLSKTGDLTWTGQVIAYYYQNSPNNIVRVDYAYITLTMNRDGKSFEINGDVIYSYFTRQ
jgi:ABC-type phosphate transport system substrate-binding protein